MTDMNPDPLKGHGWRGRACEGGSNTNCSLQGCGLPRLAKVHAGFQPVHVEVSATTQGVSVTAVQNETTEPQPTPEAVAVWDAYSAMVRDLLFRKAGYGNSWRHQGYMGNVGRVLSKSDRLRNLVWADNDFAGGGGQQGEESVMDTLLDIGPLAAFAIANLDDGNRWGR